MSRTSSEHRHARQFAMALLLVGSGLLVACDSGSSPTQGSARAPATPECTGDAARDPRDCALSNGIQAPQDKARAVEAQVLDAAKKQQEQIDAQSGD